MIPKRKDAANKEPVRSIASLFFTLFLMLALFSYHAYHLTSLETVERIGVIAAEEIIDIQSIIELYYPELQALAEREPDELIVVPGLNLELDVEAGELRDIPQERIGEFVSAAIIREMYMNGVSETLLPTGFPEESQTEFDRLTGFVGTFISKEFNDRVYLLFVFSGALALLCAVLLFVSSRGFAKLTGFGGSLMMVGLGAVFVALVRSRAAGMMQESGLTSRIMTEGALPFLALAQRNYLIVLLSGVGLFLAGRSGMFLTRKKVLGGANEVEGPTEAHHRDL